MIIYVDVDNQRFMYLYHKNFYLSYYFSGLFCLYSQVYKQQCLQFVIGQ